MFFVKGEMSRSHEIDEKVFTKNSDCLKNTRVEQTHDGSGQLDERNSSSTHTVKEQSCS